MEKYYRFAGIELAISIPEKWMYPEDLQLTAFRTDSVTHPHRYRLEVAGEFPEQLGEPLAYQPGSVIYAAGEGYIRYQGISLENANIRAEHRGLDHRVTIKNELVASYISARLVLNSLDVEHLVSAAGGVILHSSYIARERKAIVFTAPSGTGKSTQAELWKKHRGSEIINGDRAVLIREAGCICAAGLPFSGSSSYCGNRTLPLAAVVCLKQAPETTIRRIRGLEAFRKIWEGCCVNTWNREDMAAASALVEALLEQVPVFELACTPDESAVNALEAQLRKQESR